MSDLKEVKEYFDKDFYASRQTGIEIVAAEPGYAKCSLKIEEKHKNSRGRVMGGVSFTMADYAFAVAANFKQRPTVTHTSQIIYLASPRGSVLYAEAKRIRSGRSTCLYEIRVSDDTGEDIAFVTATGFIIG